MCAAADDAVRGSLFDGGPACSSPTGSAKSATGRPYKGNYGRSSGALPAPLEATNPEDDAEFLAVVRTRAEEQRRRAREQGSASD